MRPVVRRSMSCVGASAGASEHVCVMQPQSSQDVLLFAAVIATAGSTVVLTALARLIVVLPPGSLRGIAVTSAMIFVVVERRPLRPPNLSPNPAA
ncbi:MAG TPA: hypothetical protein VE010_11910, partial [Thermoanaerobaculia bacterium]|nr:hypothetical protein [Thermoanaerobaculia bacterium]